MNDHALVDLVNIDQVVDIRLTDIFSAAAKGKEVNQSKIEDCQSQSGEREAKGKGIGQAE